MAKVGIRYYYVVNGNGFWKPGKHARAAGFRNAPCGPDGPQAWAEAERWNARWDAAKAGVPLNEPTTGIEGHEATEARRHYPHGSIGAAFKRYRGTNGWRNKAPATRADWFYAWERIRPIMGDVDPSTVGVEEFGAFRDVIEREHGENARFKVVKTWRALWKIMVTFGLCDAHRDPSKNDSNPMPVGRSETWSEGEAVRLIKGAVRMGYGGLGALMAVVWDTALQPGDARSLTPEDAYQDAAGLFFDLTRGKTGKPVLATLSGRSQALLEWYVGGLDIELHDKAPIFRNRSGRPYTKDKLAADFRAVRTAVFGDGEKRKLMDFRRSGAVEAQAGEAQPDHVSKKLGNSLASSARLQRTYQPAKVATIRLVDDARKLGRDRLRGNDSATKVAMRWREKSQ